MFRAVDFKILPHARSSLVSLQLRVGNFSALCAVLKYSRVSGPDTTTALLTGDLTF